MEERNLNDKFGWTSLEDLKLTKSNEKPTETASKQLAQRIHQIVSKHKQQRK